MPDKTKLKEEIKDILGTVLSKNPSAVEEDRSLRSIGLDSVGMIEFIAGLETKFNFRIGDEDLTPETFKNLNTVAELVLRNIK